MQTMRKGILLVLFSWTTRSSDAFQQQHHGQHQHRGTISIIPGTSRSSVVLQATPVVDEGLASAVASSESNEDSSSTSLLPSLLNQQQQQQRIPAAAAMSDTKNSYQKGLWTIGFCTLVFASLSPVNHAALNSDAAMPVLQLNAIVSVVAFLSVTLGGRLLENGISGSSSNSNCENEEQSADESTSSNIVKKIDNTVSSWKSNPMIGGAELGFWKFAGTTANLYGLSLTTVDHAAFLIQLTTLIVPVVQGMMGVPISLRIQSAIALALVGIFLFTQDATGIMGDSSVAAEATAASANVVDAATTPIMAVEPVNNFFLADATSRGDALCVLAAVFYATYDLRLYRWGQRMDARPLMVRKIFTQAALSVGLWWALLGSTGSSSSMDSMTTSALDWMAHPSVNNVLDGLDPTLCALVLWSGVMVNCVVPFLQVGGQQAIGPTTSQTIYSSQPLWAAIMSYFWFGETVGAQGLIGGGAFLTALWLAATDSGPSLPAVVGVSEGGSNSDETTGKSLQS